MQRKVRYKCEYCGLELANGLKMAKHERECREYTNQKKRIERLFTCLFEHYNKLGWYISIASDGHEIYVNVRKK